MNQKRLIKRVSTPSHKAQIRKLGELNYLAIGPERAQMVLFIHGAPGSKSDFVRLLKDEALSSNFRLIAVDRAGYGGSLPGKSVFSISAQASFILPILSLNLSEKLPILVGHSYGATIAAKLAMEVSVGALVLAAGGYAAEHERKFFFNPVFNHPFIKPLLPYPIAHSNDEKLAHPAELESMQSLWHKIRCPVTLIHGKNDWIVPFENSVYAQNKLVSATKIDTVFKDNLSHLIPWLAPSLIKEAIFKYSQ